MQIHPRQIVKLNDSIITNKKTEKMPQAEFFPQKLTEEVHKKEESKKSKEDSSSDSSDNEKIIQKPKTQQQPMPEESESEEEDNYNYPLGINSSVKKEDIIAPPKKVEPKANEHSHGQSAEDDDSDLEGWND
jgi:hypothetical protein